jgi:hypothetical protein
MALPNPGGHPQSETTDGFAGPRDWESASAQIARKRWISLFVDANVLFE